MELDSVTKIREAWYRLLGTTEDDPALVEQTEAVNDVAYEFLTVGCREAQRHMLKMGFKGWRKRSAALSWSGTDAADGGRYSALPTDFLRAYGNRTVSALREASGDRWGSEIDPDDDNLKGDYYYIRGEQLWLGRSASPPATVYLDYHYKHPLWSASVTIDFPMDARMLIVAEAAAAAMLESWLLGGPELEQKISRALMQWRERARGISRATKSPRQFAKPVRFGSRW